MLQLTPGESSHLSTVSLASVVDTLHYNSFCLGIQLGAISIGLSLVRREVKRVFFCVVDVHFEGRQKHT
jgi:hypothetical protein